MLVGNCTMGFLISHPVCQNSVTPGIAHVCSETKVMTSFSRSGHPPDCRTEETPSLGPSPYILKVLNRYVAGDKTEWLLKGDPHTSQVSLFVGTEVVARYLVSMTLSALMQSLYSNGNGPHKFRNYIDD
jgi:hypothetical protein